MHEVKMIPAQQNREAIIQLVKEYTDMIRTHSLS